MIYQGGAPFTQHIDPIIVTPQSLQTEVLPSGEVVTYLPLSRAPTRSLSTRRPPQHRISIRRRKATNVSLHGAPRLRLGRLSPPVAIKVSTVSRTISRVSEDSTTMFYHSGHSIAPTSRKQSTFLSNEPSTTAVSPTSAVIFRSLKKKSGSLGRSMSLRNKKSIVQLHFDSSKLLLRDHSQQRWEPFAATAPGEDDNTTEGGFKESSVFESHLVPEDGSTSEEAEKTWKDRVVKYAKIAFPHVALIVALLSYTALSAVILQAMESNENVQRQIAQTTELSQQYASIVNYTWTQSEFRSELSYSAWRDEVEVLLRKLSSTHEKRPYDPRENISSHWTFPTAVLYTLTFLTTCGYSYVEPVTIYGRIFAVVFALIGIPLMFITGADIGKFLSEILLLVWAKGRDGWAMFQERFFPDKPDEELSDTDDDYVRFRKKTSVISRKEASEDADLLDLLDEEENYGLLFPIGAYVILVSGYSALGACLYTAWEHNWEFSHAFSFSFNLITTVGLGSIIVDDFIYLILIVAYVIIGLAVVTMCVDLASTQLKAYFQKIHYFGRAKRFWGMSEDLREILMALGEIRRQKGHVTWADLKLILEQQQLSMRPFVPRHMTLWRFIDETNSVYSGHTFYPGAGGHHSFQSVDALSAASIRDLKQQLSASMKNGGTNRTVFDEGQQQKVMMIPPNDHK